ncbi:hypothetical protein LUZ60_008640 [Juncus effusus]|nr:hypothetical protein LUZ60_008640 [Juncus effusus]
MKGERNQISDRSTGKRVQIIDRRPESERMAGGGSGGVVQGKAEKKKRWTSKTISYYAARLYFLLIILQVPLFRVPCRAGICTTPIQVTSSQLIANEIFPPFVVKTLLYPGAVADSLLTGNVIAFFPKWGELLETYNLTQVKSSSPLLDIQRLEILAGSYFCAAGAFVGLIKPGRMTLFGTLVVAWGLVKEGIFGKPVNADPHASVYVHPTFALALILAFSSITYNIKKVAARTQSVSIAKPLKSSAKSKLK